MMSVISEQLDAAEAALPFVPHKPEETLS
jgi:hypothetical protein